MYAHVVASNNNAVARKQEKPGNPLKWAFPGRDDAEVGIVANTKNKAPNHAKIGSNDRVFADEKAINDESLKTHPASSGFCGSVL